MRTAQSLGLAALVALGSPALAGARHVDVWPPPIEVPAALARTIDPVIEEMWKGFDMPEALGHVQFVSQYWRLAGNAGFDASLDRVYARLTDAPADLFAPRESGRHPSPGSVSFEQYPNTEHGWDHAVGTLALMREGRADEVVLSRERERLALCINSFSTPAAGVTAPIVDVGSGARDGDYAGKDVAGAVVLGDADVGHLWRRAVVARGAIGVVSTSMGAYVDPDAPGAPPTPRASWDILQWGSVPYDAARHGFGFKATPRAAVTLRRALAAGPARVRVTIQSTFFTKPVRTLVAEIRGTTAPDERVVIAVHVQEPGANDNASGVATLTELARALAGGIRDGRIPPPARTLTFLWLDEISGSRRWLRDHSSEATQVTYMFSMDMTGEDVRKTGGSFLIERWPDPGAVWERPWDPHSEWGRSDVRADTLVGDLINDVHLAICQRVGTRTGWIVKTNPYEGGSDHTVFGAAGIPSVLDWHFTDRYYHTNLDTADKTSAEEMRNVAVSTATTAWLFASADADLAVEAAMVVSRAGRARLALEEREGTRFAAAAPDPVQARAERDRMLAAWRKWYAEAVRSAARLVVGPRSPAFDRRLDSLAGEFEGSSSRSSNRRTREPEPENP